MAAELDIGKFIGCFPYGAQQTNGYELKFNSQDSTYHVHIPNKANKKNKSTYTHTNDQSLLVIEMYQEHHRGTGHDDTTVSKLTFDRNGKLTTSIPDLKIEVSGGSKYHINTDVTDAIADDIELLGAILGPETEGLSVAIAEEIAEDIKMVVKAFNYIFTFADFLAEDGGRLNFPAVIAHDINRLCASIHA